MTFEQIFGCALLAYWLGIVALTIYEMAVIQQELERENNGPEVRSLLISMGRSLRLFGAITIGLLWPCVLYQRFRRNRKAA